MIFYKGGKRYYLRCKFKKDMAEKKHSELEALKREVREELLKSYDERNKFEDFQKERDKKNKGLFLRFEPKRL